jgi:uncharacterized protein (TIGR03437 family)
VTEANPVHPGDEVAVYLTGMGDWNQTVDPNRVVGERNGLTPVREVRAFVEGSGYQQVVYAGAVPGQLPGLSQVNVRIAPDLKFVGN